MEKISKMKLSFVTVVTFILSTLFLYGYDFNEKKPSKDLLIFVKNEIQPFSHQPLTILQERIRLLGSYHPKKKILNTILNNESNPLNQSIVDPKNQISDFDVRFEMAKILSRHQETRDEALKQYAILLKQKHHHAHLWLEISRLYIAQERFIEALDILHSIVYRSPLKSNFRIYNTDVQPREKKTNQNFQSLVNLEDSISDDQAKLELARIYSKYENSLDEAISLYQFLMQNHSDEPHIPLEISRIYIRQKKYLIALSYLYKAIEQHPQHSELLIEAAHAELGLGHAKQSHDLLLKALEGSQNPESILMDEANVFMLVGSFYKAEAIYKQALKSHPHSLDLALKLAWTFVSAQRYEEAEGIYRGLLLNYPHHPKILEALVTLKIIENDFDAALNEVDILRTLFPQDPSYLQLEAQALYKNENYTEALERYDQLSFYPKFYTQALIGQGRVYKKWGQCAEANESFQKAYDYDPSSIQAQFYQAGPEVIKKEFIQEIINQVNKPEDLIEWANIYADNGMGGIKDFYEAALNIDPHYFPAHIGLAEALSSHYEYEEAINIYLSILDDFPEASKIMIEVARVLSWSKNYENSMDWYDQVIALNPQDPVPRREKARVAYWGKFFNQSMQLYQDLLQPPVDELLFKSLQELKQQFCNRPSILTSFELVNQSLIEGSIYTGYEIFASQFANFSDDLDAKEKSQIEFILVNYLPQYRIQKAIVLESTAKYFDWQTYYLHALPVYQELIDFNPGNKEGLYGYAQDFCNLGLCKCSKRLYDHILNIDPNNNLVKMALTRNLLRTHPLIQSNYAYWSERGAGQFSNSQIARHQFDEVFEWSPTCNEHFRFIQSEWMEYPFFTQKYYPAEGQTIELNHLFNAYVKGVASVTRKNYFQKFPSRYTCLSTLWFNLYDYANLELGFERRNEIYNYFTLKQGIQAKVYWTSLKANSHAWNIVATYRHLDYNDRNTLDHLNLLVAYTFTEDPTIFKITLNANYRNTAHLTEFITSPTGKLLNIIHPYWTPQNYYSGSVMFEFRYNYAWFNYCEAPQRYIDIKLTGEDDTAHNPSIQLVVNWKHEFMYHWGFEIVGLYHRSKLWNADGIWTQVYYRF